MPRIGLCLLLCAGLLLGALPFLPAGPEDETSRKKEVLLAVQRALFKGRQHLQSGHFKAAIDILEREVPGFNVFENRDYLRALSEAYLGYITELKKANQLSEAAFYQRRLSSIDPGALLEVKGAFATLPDPKPVPVYNTFPTKPLLPPPPSIVAVTPSAPVSLIPLVQGVTASRGQVKDDPDPFEEDNTRAAKAARDLLEKAEREFDATHYDAAALLFEQAERALKGTTGTARERWAYCKLHGVVNALNGPGAPAADLEREVRLALSMAPKLDSIGRDLLRRIQERPGATPGAVAPAVEDGTVEVKHTPRQGNGWAVAETRNFRFFHVQPREAAEKAARLAESGRLAAARKWFGEPLADWTEKQRCDVYLHDTGDAYARATGQPPQCPGHSTMPMEGDRVLGRRIDLHCDDPNMGVGVLPHEVTHVVLAGRFPGALPRWADEGMAVLSEPRDRVERHLNNLPNHAQQRQLFNLGQLMRLDTYPEPRLIGPFYAQSVSLVDYLSRLRGPVVFSQFLTEGMRGNWEAALKKHYNLASFQDLQVAWERHALGDGQAARAVQP